MSGLVEEGEGEEESGVGGEEPVSTLEVAIMVIGVVVTAALVGFAVSQALATNENAAPRASVVDQRTLEDGRVAVEVRLVNDMDVGLVSATVTADCTDLRTTLRFENVPAGGTRTGTIVCPAGTTDPGASVVSWQGS